MTDELTNLMDDNNHLRGAIDLALKQHPESKLIVNNIALTLDTDSDDRLGDSAEQRKQNLIALSKRGRANLRARARALIERHPDLGRIFEDW